MNYTYDARVTYRGKLGMVKGEVYENGYLIGTFQRHADCWGSTGITHTFYSERAKARFEDFCDSLSISETIEAMAL